MKKVFKYALFTAAALSLSACAFAPKQTNNSTPASSQEKKSASNGQVEVKVKSGEYVQPRDSSADSKYLAVELEFKNLTDEKMNISESDISIYDSEDEKVDLTNRIYDESKNFKLIRSEELSKGKTLSGYLVFEVEEGKKYELQYARKTYSSDSDDEPKEVQLEVDPSKYDDNVEASKQLAMDYIDAVFLGGNSEKDAEKKSDKKNDAFVLEGDLESARNDFRSTFAEDFKRKLHYYPFTDEEVNTFIDAYEKANANKANISYEIVQYLPDTVEIKVLPETISMNTTIRVHYENFYRDHKQEYKNITETYNAADKAYYDEMMSSFESRPLNTPDRDGYKLKFVKKDGKWTMEEDYSYKRLLYLFEGNIS